MKLEGIALSLPIVLGVLMMLLHSFQGSKNHVLKKLFYVTTFKTCCVFTAGLGSKKQSKELLLGMHLRWNYVAVF